MSVMQHLSEPAKHAADALAGMTLLATLFSYLPAASALLAFVWALMRIFESYQNIKLNNRKLRGE